MMSLWDALRMNMMISYQELVRTFPKIIRTGHACFIYFSREALFRFENIVNRYRKIVGNMHYGLCILI